MASSSRPRARNPDLWLVAILLLGCALRVYRLGDQSLWFDEAFTWWASAVVPWRDFVPFLLPYGAYTPTFYLLMRGVALVGQSEYLLRFPALVFGVLSTPLIDRVGRRMGGARVGRLAALLLAINPLSIWWSKDARMYTMASFFALAATDGFIRAIDGRGWRRSIVGAMGAYLTLYVTLFVGYIQLMWWLPRFRQQARVFRSWFGSHVLAALPLAPWLVMYLAQPVRGLAAVRWIPTPSLLAPLLTLWNFTSADIDTWTWLSVLCAIIVGIVAVIGATRYYRWRSLLLAWLILPPILSYLLSFRVPTYVDRYFAFCQFAWLILLAIGLLAIRSRWTQVVAGGVIIGLMFANTLRLHIDPMFAKEDWRDAAAILQAQVQPNDRLGVQDQETIVALRYYFRAAAMPSFEVTPDLAGLDRLSASTNRVWLVYRSNLESNHRLTKSLPYDVYTQTDPTTQQWVNGNCRPPIGEWAVAGVTGLLCPPQR